MSSSGDSALQANPGTVLRSPLAGFAPSRDQLHDPRKVILKAGQNVPNFAPT
jgi:hypothetical protein